MFTCIKLAGKLFGWIVRLTLFGQGLATVSKGKARAERRKQSEESTMKNTTLIAIIAMLAAAAGALAAAFCYLRRREEELEDYEDMLFSEDYAEEIPTPEEETCGCDACADTEEE